VKNKSIGRYIAFTIIGFIIVSIGAILGKYNRTAVGIMQVLPSIIIGIGAGIFGQNLCTTFSIRAIKKAPQSYKQKEIDEKDERNIAIKDKAKAKAYDFTIIVFGVMILILALMQVSMMVIGVIFIAYLFVVIFNIYFINKYSKIM